MTTKRDPVLPVLEYFETADLPLAEQALTLARAIIRRRQPKKSASKPKAVKREGTTPGPVTQVG